MRNRASNKIISLAVAVMMMLSATPMTAGAAVQITGDTSTLTEGANLTGTQVYFGEYNSSPILWHVVATDSDTATLWTTTSMGNMAYDTTHNYGTHQNWSGSDICEWLNGTSGGSFLYDAFTDAEQEAIKDEYSTVQETTYSYTITPNQKIVLPSVAEIGNGYTTGTWGIDQSTRVFGANWWLRSPGSSVLTAAVVSSDSYVIASGTNLNSSYAIRPAFKLNLSSVIFTSAAAGGKSVTAGDTLSAAEPPTDAVKLTVLDSANLSLASVTPQSVNGRTITFDCTAATAGKTLSAIVTDSGGEVKYYGKLAEYITDTEAASATVPDDFATGDTLQIFVEEINTDYDTDFACTPVTLNFSPQSAPTGLVGVKCTTSANNNGKITGTTMAMEYSADNGQNWIACTATETIDLAQGSYHVRYAGKTDGTTTYLASDSVQVTVGGFTNTTSGGGGVSTYTVTFDSKEGSAVSKYTGVTYGNTIKIPADPTKSGYTFAGWYKDDITFNNPWDFTTDKVTSNITLYAKWTSDSSPVPVLNGWVKAGDDYYYYKEGVKVTSSWITTKAGNKYYVGANGKIAKSKWITTKYGNKYYVQANGRMARSKWITTKAGNKYYVQANGRMARSKWITTKAGNKYYVDKNGRMTKKK